MSKCRSNTNVLGRWATSEVHVGAEEGEGGHHYARWRIGRDRECSRNVQYILHAYKSVMVNGELNLTGGQK